MLRIVPERALVLGGVSPRWTGTWAFVLEPLGPNKTRLVTRYRAAYPPSPRMSILLPVLAAVHAFMERKQLRTIKHHAEADARGVRGVCRPVILGRKIGFNGPGWDCPPDCCSWERRSLPRTVPSPA